jgi:valyl-tRNA synthetase
VVETRLFELEGKTRHDIGREALVERIWKWKDQYQERIVGQQQRWAAPATGIGSASRWTGLRARRARGLLPLFRDGLIYRGNRLVNWDCHLQTAVADDEVEHETVHGGFWHLRYPVIDPQPGEPEHIVVATTRPETMLGDTAVACHPHPGKQLEALIAKRARARRGRRPPRRRKASDAELERLEARVARRTCPPRAARRDGAGGRKIRCRCWIARSR